MIVYFFIKYNCSIIIIYDNNMINDIFRPSSLYFQTKNISSNYVLYSGYYMWCKRNKKNYINYTYFNFFVLNLFKFFRSLQQNPYVPATLRTNKTSIPKGIATISQNFDELICRMLNTSPHCFEIVTSLRCNFTLCIPYIKFNAPALFTITVSLFPWCRQFLKRLN